MTDEITQPSETDYYTVPQFSKKHPAFPEGGLRWKIFNAKTNGLEDSGAIVRDGRKCLIHEGRFFKHIDKRR